jgi:succinyl-CoA synthetase beta subunit
MKKLQSIRLEKIEAGNIGILCCGAGLCMTTLDLIYQAQGQPASAIDLEDLHIQSLEPTEIADRVTKALEAIASDRSIEVIFINLLATIVGCDVLAQGIYDYASKFSDSSTIPKLVVRLAGRNYKKAQQILSQANLESWEILDKAVEAAIDRSREAEKVAGNQE